MLMKCSIEGEPWCSVTVLQIKNRCPIISPTPSSEAFSYFQIYLSFCLDQNDLPNLKTHIGNNPEPQNNSPHRSSYQTLPVFLISISFWMLFHSLPSLSLTGSNKIASEGVSLPPGWPSPHPSSTESPGWFFWNRHRTLLPLSKFPQNLLSSYRIKSIFFCKLNLNSR